MSLGQTPVHQDLFRSSTAFCDERISAQSIYGILHRQGHRLFPDEAFADLFQGVGRDSVPPQIVAVVMVLQRLEGASDREAVERFAFDLRWKYAAGGLSYDYPGFVHTVLVGMRARLRRSERPKRIFETVLEVAKEAGLVGRKRVLDSTALYDAVATQDTVTLVRSSIRSLLRVAEEELERELRAQLRRDDDYRAPGKPRCDWDDETEREALIDALAKDAEAVLSCLEGRKLSSQVEQAAQLVATVVGQDLDLGEDGIFRIARRVAEDRVISTVDPEARHGHKTAARGFDGYKGHISVDPDSELIVATEVTPGNAADGSVAKELLKELFKPSETAIAPEEDPVEVFGDASYGTAELVEHVEEAGAKNSMKVQGPSGKKGMYSKADFAIDAEGGTVTCPQGSLAQIRKSADGGGLAPFGAACKDCPQRPRCTEAKEGRVIRLHPKEATLQRERQRQKAPEWRAHYKATRPKVERKIAHLMFRRHGGRRARVRGCERVRHDFALLGAAVNLKRLAVLGVHFGQEGWTH
jgi:hypothetical protein